MTGQTPELPKCSVPDCAGLVVVQEPLPLCAEDGLAVLQSFSEVALNQMKEAEVTALVAQDYAPFRLEEKIPPVEYIVDRYDVDQAAASRIQMKLIYLLAGLEA